MTYYAVRQVAAPVTRVKAIDLYDYFEVAKFGDGDQPENVYDVSIHRATGKADCNCPAAMYHGKQGQADKHVRMVMKWIADGKPTPSHIEAK